MKITVAQHLQLHRAAPRPAPPVAEKSPDSVELSGSATEALAEQGQASARQAALAGLFGTAGVPLADSVGKLEEAGIRFRRREAWWRFWDRSWKESEPDKTAELLERGKLGRLQYQVQDGEWQRPTLEHLGELEVFYTGAPAERLGDAELGRALKALLPPEEAHRAYHAVGEGQPVEIAAYTCENSEEVVAVAAFCGHPVEPDEVLDTVLKAEPSEPLEAYRLLRQLSATVGLGPARPLWRALLPSLGEPGLKEAVASLLEPARDQVESQGRWRRESDGAWSRSPYSNGENDSLTTPWISLQGLQGSRVRFDTRYGLEENYDFCHLEARTRGGEWKKLESLTGGAGRWEHRIVDLSAFDGDAVQLRLRLTSDSSNTGQGVFVSRLAVSGRAEGGAEVRYRTADPGSDLADITALAREGLLFEAAELKQRLGSTEEALRLARRAPQLADLAVLHGVDGVERLVSELGGSSADPRLETLGALASEFDVEGGLHLWRQVAAGFGQPGFEERLSALANLARQAGPGEATPLFQILESEGRGSLPERLELMQLALDMTDDGRQRVKHYRRLARLEPGAPERAALSRLVHAPRPPEQSRWSGGWGSTSRRGREGVVADSLGGNYRDGASTSTELQLNLRGLERARLSFESWNEIEEGYDFLRVEARRPRGEWKELARFSGEETRWTRHEVDLSHFDQGDAELRFRLTSDGSNNAAGAHLSRLFVTGRGERGVEVRLRAAEPRADSNQLLHFLEGGGDIQALERLAGELGSVDLALQAGPGVGTPQEKLLTDLAVRHGSEGAAALWRRVQDRPEQAGVLADLALDFGSQWGARLFEALGPDPDRDAREALHSLAAKQGPEQALILWPSLESHGSGTFAQRLEVLELARRLAERANQEVDPGRQAAFYVKLTGRTAEELRRLEAMASERLRLDEDRLEAQHTWARASYGGRDGVWSDSPGGAYRDRENSSLTTPPIALTGRNASLRFQARHALEDRYDFCRVEIAPRGGDFEEVATLTGSADWTEHELDLSRYDGQTVRVRFRLTSDGSTGDEGICLSRLAVVADADEGAELLFKAAEPPIDGEALLEVQDFEGLSRAAARLGSLELASQVWPRLERLDEKLRPSALDMALRHGAEGLDRLWPLLDTHQNPQAFEGVAALAARFGTRQTPALWKDLSAHLGTPEFPEALAAMTGLDPSAEVLADFRALKKAGKGSYPERLRLLEAAGELGQTSGHERRELYRRLVELGVDAGAEGQLRTLSELRLRCLADKPWAEEGRWGRSETNFWSDSPGTEYRDRDDNSLVTPVLSLEGADRAFLTFQARYELENGYDFCRLEARRPGQEWTEVKAVTGEASDWKSMRADLSDFAGGRVQLRFRLTSDGSNAYQGIDLSRIELKAVGPKGTRTAFRAAYPPVDPKTLLRGLDASEDLAHLEVLGRHLDSLEKAATLLPLVRPVLDRPEVVDRLAQIYDGHGAEAVMAVRELADDPSSPRFQERLEDAAAVTALLDGLAARLPRHPGPARRAAVGAWLMSRAGPQESLAEATSLLSTLPPAQSWGLLEALERRPNLPAPSLTQTLQRLAAAIVSGKNAQEAIDDLALEGLGIEWRPDEVLVGEHSLARND